MSRGIFIIGTDTDVGKTFITGGLTYVLRKNGYNTCCFKPIQSGGTLKENKLIPDDVNFVKTICSIDESYDSMNVYCLKEAVSPHLASNMEDMLIDKDTIVDSYKKLQEKYDYIIVEGAGGIIVPLIENEYFVYDLIKDLNLSCIIVCKAGVGTINHTVLTYEFVKSKGIDVKGIIVNKYNKKFYEDDNIKTIESITGLKVISIVNDLKENMKFNNIKREYEKSIYIENILKLF